MNIKVQLLELEIEELQDEIVKLEFKLELFNNETKRAIKEITKKFDDKNINPEIVSDRIKKLDFELSMEQNRVNRETKRLNIKIIELKNSINNINNIIH